MHLMGLLPSLTASNNQKVLAKVTKCKKIIPFNIHLITKTLILFINLINKIKIYFALLHCPFLYRSRNSCGERFRTKNGIPLLSVFGPKK
jgi:hypothetical protein